MVSLQSQGIRTQLAVRGTTLDKESFERFRLRKVFKDELPHTVYACVSAMHFGSTYVGSFMRMKTNVSTTKNDE